MIPILKAAFLWAQLVTTPQQQAAESGRCVTLVEKPDADRKSVV